MTRAMAKNSTGAALIIIDVQKGFDDADYWGPRNNPDAEANIARLAAHARRRHWLVVAVLHASKIAGSPLAAGTPGYEPKDPALYSSAGLTIVKSTRSAFFGEPGLDQELRARGIGKIVLCGIQTNHCVETTARVGGDFGYEVVLPLDATHTFDFPMPGKPVFAGEFRTAEEVSAATAVSLHGSFATVTSTEEVVR